MRSANYRLRAHCLILLVFAAALIPQAGCSDSTAPGVQPEITNVVDNFQFQTSYVRVASGDWTYTWQNTGTVANVNQSCSISSGIGTLTISDADGAQVYSRSLSDNGTFVTAAGAAGNWTIRVTLSRVTADALNFRVQKST